MNDVEALLTVEDIHLTKDRSLLKGVSFELRPGELLTVLGPSGSGKTTLLRCLNRLETIDSGKISLKNKDTRSLPVQELRRRVGMVFQIPELLPLKLADNINCGPNLYNRPLNENEIRTLLKQVGLNEELLEQEVSTFSVGERQRVALAQVLANRPEILLLDEPTSALDRTSMLIIETLITQIHQQFGVGIILVTHDLEQAQRLDSRTLVLKDGEVFVEGPFKQLKESHNETLRKFFKGEDL